MIRKMLRAYKKQVSAYGVRIGTDNARVSHNVISALERKKGDGIALVRGLDPSGIDRCQILANRISGIAGHGIVLRAAVRSAMIKHNMIEGTQSGGIVMDEGSSAEVLSVENNQIWNIAPGENADARSAVVGIRLLNARQTHVVDNMVKGIGLFAIASSRRAGIQVIASTLVRISGNVVSNIGPAGGFAGLTAGIDVLPTLGSVDVLDNAVTRGEVPEGSSASANWHAVIIRGPMEEVFTLDNHLMLVPLANAVLVIAGDRFRLTPHGLEIAAIRGNLLEASVTSASLADVRVSGSCQFSDNRCLLNESAAFARVPSSPLANLAAGTLIVSGNHFMGPRMQAAVRLDAPEKRFTVLGKIASDPIFINGKELDVPWAPLNLIVQ